ncbi:hypothetical protein [Orrella sp. 11846]|uniref:hypothetical protein n=1 Tax=Orrella sp. 11846 TaxID=3409913 RepID=UPI003B5CA888
MQKKYLLSTAIFGLMIATSQTWAQSAAETIERARSEAREFNEYKVALEDPDQSVRLALFEEMLKLPNPPLRMMAIQTGINSTDNILRSRALQAQIMGMEQLHFQISVNPKAPSKAQERTRAFIEKEGGSFVLYLYDKDNGAGTFKTSGFKFDGQIRNLQVQLYGSYGQNKIDLHLLDDNLLQGTFLNTSNDINALVSVQLF